MSPSEFEKPSPDVRVVLVGDSGVGKTALLRSYLTTTFQANIERTLIDRYEVTVNVKGKETLLAICDTAGRADLVKFRQAAYSGSDVIVICFSLIDPSTFEDVNEYVKEIQTLPQCEASIILVGTKSDLRDMTTDANSGSSCINSSQHISPHQGQQLSERICAASYIETSAYNHEGVKDVFDAVIMMKFNGYVKLHKRKKKCTLL